MNFWLDGIKFNTSLMYTDHNNPSSIEDAKSVFFALLKELLENPALKKFRMEAIYPECNYNFCRFVITTNDRIYADCVDGEGRIERKFLFDCGNHIEIDIGLVLSFAKDRIDDINKWLENHPIKDDLHHDIRLSYDEYDNYKHIRFWTDDLLVSDVGDDE